LLAITLVEKVSARPLTDELGMAMTVLGRLSASQSVLHHRMSVSCRHHRALLCGLSFPKAASKVILRTAHIDAGSHSTLTSHQHGTTRASSSFLSMRKACSATAAMLTLALIQ